MVGNGHVDGVGTGNGSGVGSGGGGGTGTGVGGGVGTGGGGGVGSGSGGGVGTSFFSAPDPARRRSDIGSLHPEVRKSVEAVLIQCAAEKLPFEVFETFRTPARQQWLFMHGRGLPGTKVVTRAEPWSSYHQYGLAVDLVLRINGAWSWSTRGRNNDRWKRLHAIARSEGLEPLSFEKPHLQMAGLKIADLRAGHFPKRGDDLWWDNLEATSIMWKDFPPGPIVGSGRPAIAA